MTKTVLITGASSGFGKITAKLFHRNGWNVIASMRSPEKETELSSLEGILTVLLDVTDPSSIQKAVDKGLETFGSIDVLINNAGLGFMGILETATDDMVKNLFDVNVFGLINVTKIVLPVMRKAKTGVIINLSSMGGKVTMPYMSVYNATKFAVEGLTESMQFELNPLGIQFKLIEPGLYGTNFRGGLSTSDPGNIEDYKPGYSRGVGALAAAPPNADINEVAETIYAAATDGSEQLRYPVGADAVRIMAIRPTTDDVDFKHMLQQRFGI